MVKQIKTKLDIFMLLMIALIVIWLVVLGVISLRYFKFESSGLAISNMNDLAGIESIPTALNLIQNQIDSFQYIVDNKNLLFPTNNQKQKINLATKVLYTSLGEIYAIYDSVDNRYTIYFNQKPISQLANPIASYVFELPNNHVILVFDAETVGHDLIYKILDLTLYDSHIIHEVGNYERLLSVDLGQGSNCLSLRFEDARKYTDEGDYQLYRYCGDGNVTKVLDVKSDDYYNKKFAKLNARQIYDIADHDGCLNSIGNAFYMNRACSYATKYCHMLRSIPPANNDKFYQLLEKACNQRSGVISSDELVRP